MYNWNYEFFLNLKNNVMWRKWGSTLYMHNVRLLPWGYHVADEGCGLGIIMLEVILCSWCEVKKAKWCEHPELNNRKVCQFAGKDMELDLLFYFICILSFLIGLLFSITSGVVWKLKACKAYKFRSSIFIFVNEEFWENYLMWEICYLNMFRIFLIIF